MNIEVDIKKYFELQKDTDHINDIVDISVESHAYLPQVEDVKSDWLSFVSVPAFKIARKENGKDFGSFLSLGTGSGLDVLAGAEILGAKTLGFTDLQKSVVDIARQNVEKGLKKTGTYNLLSGAGDLFAPFAKDTEPEKRPKFDVIYENLPNVPLDDNKEVTDSRNSGHYLEKRVEKIPDEVHGDMLDLHYLALVQAGDYLTDNGFVFSLMGGRVPLSSFIRLGELAGVHSEIYSYQWKVQAEPEDVIGGYAKQEEEGFGPFIFYKAEDLEEAFKGVSVEESGRRAFEIEKSLEDKRLTATKAYEIFKNGGSIGHTVVVLKSYV